MAEDEDHFKQKRDIPVDNYVYGLKTRIVFWKATGRNISTNHFHSFLRNYFLVKLSLKVTRKFNWNWWPRKHKNIRLSKWMVQTLESETLWLTGNIEKCLSFFWFRTSFSYILCFFCGKKRQHKRSTPLLRNQHNLLHWHTYIVPQPNEFDPNELGKKSKTYTKLTVHYWINFLMFGYPFFDKVCVK